MVLLSSVQGEIYPLIYPESRSVLETHERLDVGASYRRQFARVYFVGLLWKVLVVGPLDIEQ